MTRRCSATLRPPVPLLGWRLPRTLLTALVCLATAGCQAEASGTERTVALPFSSGRQGLVTNEYAFWNASSPSRVVSPVWEMTSGSLLVREGKGWTGQPDAVIPDATSANGTGSAVFRLTSRRSDFADMELSFDVKNQGLTTTARTPAVDWDGIHVFLRYQNEHTLYYASVNRRDDTVTIKKKVPGGESNGGTYYDLARLHPYTVPYGAWQHVRATIENQVDGTVRITLEVDGRELVSAVDSGIGGDPITAAGKVGIRGDNSDFLLGDFRVSRIHE